MIITANKLLFVCGEHTSHLLALFSKFQVYNTLLVPVGFPSGSMVKNLPADAGDMGSIPELRGSLGEGNSNPLQ